MIHIKKFLVLLLSTKFSEEGRKKLRKVQNRLGEKSEQLFLVEVLVMLHKLVTFAKTSGGRTWRINQSVWSLHSHSVVLVEATKRNKN